MHGITSKHGTRILVDVPVVQKITLFNVSSGTIAGMLDVIPCIQAQLDSLSGIGIATKNWKFDSPTDQA